MCVLLPCLFSLTLLFLAFLGPLLMCIPVIVYHFLTTQIGTANAEDDDTDSHSNNNTTNSGNSNLTSTLHGHTGKRTFVRLFVCSGYQEESMRESTWHAT